VKNHVSNRPLLATVIALVVCAVCSGALAAEFSADFTEQQGDNSKSGTIYVRGPNYCLDIVEDGEQMLIIVNPEKQKTIVIPVSMGEYRELAIDDMTSIMSDPLQGFLYAAANGELNAVAAETVNGYECDKSVVTMGDTEVMSRWVARSLDFPIKIVAHGPPDKVFELTNIVVGPVDDSKFVIPAGFTLWIDPATLPVEPPAWAEGIAAAPVMVPPFEHDMSAGDIIRVKVASGKSFKIKGVSKTDANAIARVIPFKDDRPLRKASRYNNFAQRGTICARLHETSAEVDELVVYVYEGDITATAKWQEMLEKTVAEGEEIRLPLPDRYNIETRLVNLSDAESVAIVSYFLDGSELGEDDMGPIKWRTITLKEHGEVEDGARSHNGDEIVVSVQKGKMLIKLGQFDSFEF
jgi:hypothetical protein